MIVELAIIVADRTLLSYKSHNSGFVINCIFSTFKKMLNSFTVIVMTFSYGVTAFTLSKTIIVSSMCVNNILTHLARLKVQRNDT